MNKARLIKNRSFIEWTGKSKIKFINNEKLIIKKFIKRIRKKGNIWGTEYFKKFKNEEYD